MTRDMTRKTSTHKRGRQGIVQRRGRSYYTARDLHGRFIRFTRVTKPTTERISSEERMRQKHISFYGTAVTHEDSSVGTYGGMYKARVDAYGKGKDLCNLVTRLREGYVPRQRHRHVFGSVENIEENFQDYFTFGEWSDSEVES